MHTRMPHRSLSRINTEIVITVLCFYLCGLQETEGACNVVQQFITCVNGLMLDERLNQLNGTFALTIRNLHSFLRTERKLEWNQGAQINSLQLQRGTVLNVESGFFARYSNRGLRTLSISHINGMNQLLNARSLMGLEDRLTELQISDCSLFNLNDFIILNKLNTLRLVRTNLTRLPNNFPSLMQRLDNIDLSENQLTTLPWDVVAKLVLSDRFQKIQLLKNAWICDCSLRPLIELRYQAKAKIYQFRCHQPSKLAERSLNELTVNDVCTEDQISITTDSSRFSPKDSDPKSDSRNPFYKGDRTGVEKPSVIPLDEASASGGNRHIQQKGDEDPAVSMAGNISMEVIIVIIVVAIIFIIIVMAILIYKARKAAALRKQQERNTGVTHKTNSYCAVIEHPASTSRHHRKQMHNTSDSEGMNGTEREPLSRQFDHRL